MPKVKKESDKQRQRLDKVRKRDERTTNEKEVQAKHALKKSSIASVDVHVANNNLVFHCYICISCLELHHADYHVEGGRVFNNFLFTFFVGRWKRGNLGRPL